MFYTDADKALVEAMGSIPAGSQDLDQWGAWLDHVSRAAEASIAELQVMVETYEQLWWLKPLRGIARRQADLAIAEIEVTIIHAHHMAQQCLNGEMAGSPKDWMH